MLAGWRRIKGLENDGIGADKRTTHNAAASHEAGECRHGRFSAGAGKNAGGCGFVWEFPDIWQSEDRSWDGPSAKLPTGWRSKETPALRKQAAHLAVATQLQQLVDAAFSEGRPEDSTTADSKKTESPASPTNPASCNGTAHGAEYNTAAARTAATGLQAEESPDFENRPAWPWKPEEIPTWMGLRQPTSPPRGGRGGKAASPPTTPGTAGRSDAAGTGSAPAKGVCPPLRQSTPGPTQAPR